MSVEMIDRVAKDLCDFDLGKDAWDFTGQHDCRDDYRALARVALKAMREPTERMRQAFYSLDQIGEPTPCVEGWQAMIDAALEQ